MKHLYLLVFGLFFLTISHLGRAQNIITTNATSQSTCDGTAYFSDYSNFDSTWTWTWAWDDSTVISSGDTMITGLCGSNYLLILDSLGTQVYTNFTILNPCSYFTYTSSVINCSPGNCDGAIDFIPNGVGPYTYYWSNGSTTQSLINTCPALYNMQCTDANGCIIFYTASVVDSTQLTPIVPNLTKVNDLTNNNSCNGSATVSPTGGTGPYTYQWNNGSTSSSAVNLCAGTAYSVTIYDALYNDTTINFTISGCANFSWGVSGVDCTPYPLGVCDGGINFTAYGGTPPYSYAWSNGDTTQNLTNVCPGPYSVECTDAIGCIMLFSSGVWQDTLLSANVNTFDDYTSNCFGSASVSSFGGTAPYNMLWSNGQTGSSISGLCAGIYSVTVWDAAMDSITVSFIIADSSTIYGNNPFPNGTVNDTLYTNLLTNCFINYNVIDSASLYQAVYDSSNQNLYVTWVVYSPIDTVYISDTLGLAGATGYYTLTISVYCPNKSGSDFFKIEQVIYFDGTNVWLSPILGIDEQLLNSLTIYPNPFNNSISVDNKDGVIQSVKLVDLNGRVISEMNQINSGLIELNQLESVSNGTYLLILSGENSSKTYKVIK
ncbi:T9SS type A sorting domain-containing protein [Fluviicola sp.]|uniref:T9SS type A sorting domain-containing protein n=1 Tax=Fluviicola sp. TaxID=1917219 RepID=UPI003D2A439C